MKFLQNYFAHLLKHDYLSSYNMHIVIIIIMIIIKMWGLPYLLTVYFVELILA